MSGSRQKSTSIFIPPNIYASSRFALILSGLFFLAPLLINTPNSLPAQLPSDRQTFPRITFTLVPRPTAHGLPFGTVGLKQHPSPRQRPGASKRICLAETSFVRQTNQSGNLDNLKPVVSGASPVSRFGLAQTSDCRFGICLLGLLVRNLERSVVLCANICGGEACFLRVLWAELCWVLRWLVCCVSGG
jgi:hypothetical protein